MRSWLILGMGIAVYAAAITHRTSLGVAAPQAAEQFGTTASVIALFVVLQVGVYAFMQVPAGVLVDRFGSRRMLTAGAALMAIGQLLLAMSDSVPLAVVARMITGAADAACFISALRLIPAWFPAKRIPLLTQVTGSVGQLGQVISAVPFVWVLHNFGWSRAFLTLAIGGLVIAAAAFLLIRDSPKGHVRRDTQIAERFFSQLVQVVREPGTRLGMFEHALSCFGALSFGLMWGFPYLLEGEGLSPAAAGALFTVMVIGSIIAAPIIGQLTRRHPMRRSTLAMLVSLAGIVPWLVIFAWPGPAPMWLLVVLVLGLSVAGPGSGIGLDHGRTFNPPQRMGTASGLVVMTGFTFVLIAVLFIGVALDLATGGQTPTLGDYRLAMAAQIPLWIFCWIMLLVSRQQTRKTHSMTIPSWGEVWRRERDRRRGA
ncbi:MFS transporter [Ammonicoccus fulvus]|uniref:MFS transporter n=1 Tax=Ammonicoccus fulvus TaxID=3138240 RepID=A0ABZ3FR33_9ACTN